MKWLFYIFIFLTFTSCVDFNRSGYIEKIDTSIEALKQSKLKLDNSVFDSIPTVLAKIKAVKTKIRSFLKNDTLPLEIALKIDEANRIENALKKIELEIPIVLKDIDALKISFNNLKKDINNGSGNRGKYAENIEIEKVNQTLIVNSVDNYFTNCSAAIKSFNEIENELKSFSNELELKNKEQKLIP